MKILNISKVDGPLHVSDPFILASGVSGQYPKANGKLAPSYYLPQTKFGNDFDRSKPWRMFHGRTIPGFLQHPHRGFEIVTIVPEGYADHFDSKGATGRYGNGDAQLISVGSGLQHSEMFPLVNDEDENPFRLFQIWLNLPAAKKMSDPAYKMLWREKIPVAEVADANGKIARVKVIVGNYNGVASIPPLENSWAANPDHHVGVALVELEAHASWTLPAVSKTLHRTVMYYQGEEAIHVEGAVMEVNMQAQLAGNETITFQAGNGVAKLLILEGEPINEPVAAYGPFVMNTRQELEEAFAEFRKTEFGGWSWGDNEADIVHPKEAGRFASYDFGKVVEYPEELKV